MSIGFRKSLFGFHCEDVLTYIQQSQKKFADMQTDLTEQVQALTDELALSKESCAALDREKEALSAKLAELNEQYDEIERLSQNIGKLYLVAQANAQAIMENSEQSAAVTKQEIDHNLSVIGQAHTTLDELKKSVVATSQDFVSEIDSLLASLEETRVQIVESRADSDEHREQFQRIYESIVK